MNCEIDEQDKIDRITDCEESNAGELSASQDASYQAQKLESLGRATVDIIHETNHMITVMLSSAEMARKQIDHASPARGHLDITIRAAECLGTLSGQVLGYMAEEACRPEPINVNKVVQDSEMLLRLLAGTNARISLDLAKRVPTIDADPCQVKQILVNLVLNARDAMPSGGNILISSRKSNPNETQSYDLAVPGVDYIVLSVGDTGHGIEPDVRESLFEPFFTTKGKEGGTGLGLSIVEKLVREHGGFIKLDSQHGIGTTFRVFLPLQPVQQADA